jgi:hypothetical protein
MIITIKALKVLAPGPFAKANLKNYYRGEYRSSWPYGEGRAFELREPTL